MRLLKMLTFIACVSAIISIIIALMHKYDGSPHSDNKITVGIKVFVVSFIVLYIGLVFFTPQLSFVSKAQVIETGEPDF